MSLFVVTHDKLVGVTVGVGVIVGAIVGMDVRTCGECVWSVARAVVLVVGELVGPVLNKNNKKITKKNYFANKIKK